MEHTDITNGFMSSAFTQSLPGHPPYPLATSSSMVSQWLHSFEQPFPAPSFWTALLFLLLLFTNILSIIATFSWPLSISGKPRPMEEVKIKTILSNLPLIWSLHSTPSGSIFRSQSGSPYFTQVLTEPAFFLLQHALVRWGSWTGLMQLLDLTRQTGCSLIRMRIISKTAHFCSLCLRNQICINLNPLKSCPCFL